MRDHQYKLSRRCP